MNIERKRRTNRR